MKAKTIIELLGGSIELLKDHLPNEDLLRDKPIQLAIARSETANIRKVITTLTEVMERLNTPTDNTTIERVNEKISMFEDNKTLVRSEMYCEDLVITIERNSAIATIKGEKK